MFSVSKLILKLEKNFSLLYAFLMGSFKLYIKQTITYNLLLVLLRNIRDFLETIGDIFYRLCQVLRYLLTFQINFKQLAEQSSRFAVDSLPITLSIVSMTAIILAMQIAPEITLEC